MRTERIKTGLFFGSFNPIHCGHLILAQSALTLGGMDEVWLVVSPQNPFKEAAGLAPAETRLMLAQLATMADPRIRVTDVELSLPTPSYTVRTLEHLRQTYADREFVIVMGGDNLAGFPRWREPEEIARHHRIMVYPRPGETLDTKPIEEMGGTATMLNAPLMDISSTMLRKWMSEGKDVRHFVPDPVWDWLRSHDNPYATSQR